MNTGEAVSITWSVESYVASVVSSTTQTQAMKDLAYALLTYGDAAAAYLAS